MKQEVDDFVDDNRTVADMSNVEGGFGRLLFGALGDRKQRRAKKDADEDPDGELIRDPGERVPEEKPAYYVGEQMTPEDRRLYIFGAMGAAFAIGMVFLAAAFIVILIMVLVW